MLSCPPKGGANPSLVQPNKDRCHKAAPTPHAATNVPTHPPTALPPSRAPPTCAPPPSPSPSRPPPPPPRSPPPPHPYTPALTPLPPPHHSVRTRSTREFEALPVCAGF